MRLAILSPNENAYSETFIQSQKQHLSGNIFYYYGGQLPRKLEGHGSIIIKYAGLKRKLGFIENDTRLASLKRSFKKNKIDVVLAQYGPTGNAICQACKALDIPLVVHFHGYDASVKSVIKNNNNYKAVFCIASKVIAVSKEMVRDLKLLGCPTNKIVYNPCAPDNSFLDLIMRNPKKKQFIAVGRFTDKKAPYFTILAFSKVLEKHPDAMLIFGGEGPLLNTCENLAEYLKIEKSVIFKGVISSEEFKELLKNSLTFVQHSLEAENGDKEGTPVAILEASAAGLPVISTYHAGIPDVILHNKTGLLSQEHDVDQMAKHMIELLDHPEKAKMLGANGRNRIKENFSLNQHINNLQKILQTAVYGK